MSAKTTDIGPPIRHPSICLINRLFTEKVHSFINFINNFLKIGVFLSFLYIAIITVKDAGYGCIIHGISKSEAINLLENSALNDLGDI